MKHKKISRNNGTPLQIARESLGMSQEYVAEKICKSRQTISKYEEDISKMPVEVLVQLSELYHVSTDYLLGIDKQTNKYISQRFGFNDDVIANLDELIREDNGNIISMRFVSSFCGKLTRNLFVSALNGVMSNYSHFRALLNAFITYAMPNQYNVPICVNNGKYEVIPDSKNKNGYVLKMATGEDSLLDYTEIEMDRNFLKAIARKQLDQAIEESVRDYQKYISKKVYIDN